jgi:hypothetical protein
MAGRASILAALSVTACRLGFDERDAGRVPDALQRYAAVVLADNPRAYYRLGDPQGTLVRDSTSNANHADVQTTADGEVVMGMPGALPGDSDTATYFRGEGNGGNGSVGWAEFPTLWPTWTSDFTIEAFVTALAPGPAGYADSLLLCEAYLVNGFRSGWNAAFEIELWADESGGTLSGTSSRSLATSSWTHLVIVRTGNQITVYMDGAPAGSFPFDFITPAGTATCGFGSFRGMASEMVLDELAIYDVALSQSQLAAHFAASGR